MSENLWTCLKTTRQRKELPSLCRGEQKELILQGSRLWSQSHKVQCCRYVLESQREMEGESRSCHSRPSDPTETVLIIPSYILALVACILYNYGWFDKVLTGTLVHWWVGYWFLLWQYFSINSSKKTGYLLCRNKIFRSLIYGSLFDKSGSSEKAIVPN